MEPRIVWQYFEEICQIPRPSKQEHKMCEYIKQFAVKHKLEYDEDPVGNIVIRKPASHGKENSAITILQTHLDMVCEKDEGVEHDFTKDPIKTQQKGDYLYAQGTTLGADNGIGIAAALAVLHSEDLVHGPLECLFTVDEETGLNGAQSLTSNFIAGRRLLNLDSEELGEICIGCAGGGETKIAMPLTWQKAPGGHCVKMSIEGLHGGHSGTDINIGRANAIVLLGRLLYQLGKKYAIHIHSLHGGNKTNAIPRSATALLAIADDKQAFCATARQLLEEIRPEYGKIEPNLALVLSDSEPLAEVITPECQQNLLAMVMALPNGVIAMNPDIAGLVNTSTNLARIAFEDKKCIVQTSTRSSLKGAMDSVRHKIAAVGSLAGADVEQSGTYPGWVPNMDSLLLKVTREAHGEVFSKEPIVKAIHAGLECGVIGEKIPGMDMVSFGPQIEYPHSPQERVQVSSVEPFWKVLLATLARLAA